MITVEHRVTRRSHLRQACLSAALLLTFAIGAIGSPAFAQTAPEPITLRVGVIPAFINAAIFCGIDRGFFKDAGITVDMQILSNGNAIAAAIVGGSLDLGQSDLITTALARQRGVNIAFVAPGITVSNDIPASALAVRADSPIVSAKDMNGTTIAVNGLNNLAWLSAALWMDRHGGDSKTVKWLELPFPATLPAVTENRVQAGLVIEPFWSLAKQQGFRLFPTTIDLPYMGNGYVATDEWLKANTAKAVRFARVVVQVNRWMNTHRDDANAIIAKYTNVSVESVARTPFHFMETVTPADLQPILDAGVHYNVLAKAMSSAQLIFAPAIRQ
jgi:NitT/TauT family transport system substrate-binding protein